MNHEYLKLAILASLSAALTFSAIERMDTRGGKSSGGVQATSLTLKAQAQKARTQKQRGSQLPAIKAESRIKEEKWLKRYKGINKLVRTSSRSDVVFLGDSITHGWKFTKLWNKEFGHYRPINAGISSDRVQHLLWRVENGNFSRLKPKVAIILVGVNNLALNSPKEIAGGIKQVTAAVHKRSPNTKVLLLGIFPSGKSPAHKRRSKIRTINANLRLLADGNKIHYLNIGNKFLEKDGSISSRTMHDYLHLTNKGYQIWANAMKPTLERLIETH